MMEFFKFLFGRKQEDIEKQVAQKRAWYLASHPENMCERAKEIQRLLEENLSAFFSGRDVRRGVDRVSQDPNYMGRMFGMDIYAIDPGQKNKASAGSHGEPYKRIEDTLILGRSFFGQKVNDVQIARMIGRTPGAIKQRRRRLQKKK